MIADFFKSNDGAWKDFRRKEKLGHNEYRKRKRKTKYTNKNTVNQQNKIQAVFFVQHTPYSEMAKRMRAKMESLEKLGKFKVKIVERAGNKIVDVLHKSDAWSLMDCERTDCLICSTETSKKGSFRRRNILYETFCITCKKEAEKMEVNLYTNNLDGANQISNKNPFDDAMENEVNDTPVYVETESEIVKAGKEISQRGNSPIVVKIPEGNTSPSISSINMKETSSTDSPDIYKKGACLPPHATELPTVISGFQKRIREEEGGDDRKKEGDKGEKYKVKYIGESNRSGYERGKEHMD